MKLSTNRTHFLLYFFFIALVCFLISDLPFRLPLLRGNTLFRGNFPISASEGCAPYQLQNEIESSCRTLSSILDAGQNVYFVNTDKVSYMYCSIPKNGCTYHLSLLHRIQYNKWTLNGFEIHANKTKNTLLLARQSDESISANLRDDSIPKYVVVRNPMKRTLSAYMNKVEKYIPVEQRSPDTFYKWVNEEFPEHSRDRTTSEWLKTNAHWRPQTHFCAFRYPQIYQRLTVLRFEEPKQFVDFLYKHMPGEYLETGWGDGHQSFRESSLGVYQRTGNTNEVFFDYFPSLDRFDYLAEQLKDDIDGLGYRDEVDEMRRQLERKLAERVVQADNDEM